MFDEWAKAGGIVGALAIAAKLVWPILSKQSEASANRLETDSTLHELYQSTLKAQREMSEELAKAREEIGALRLQAREEIGALRLQVDTLTKDLEDARKALAHAEASLAKQANINASLEVKQ